MSWYKTLLSLFKVKSQTLSQTLSQSSPQIEVLNPSEDQLFPGALKARLMTFRQQGQPIHGYLVIVPTLICVLIYMINTNQFSYTGINPITSIANLLPANSTVANLLPQLAKIFAQ